MRDLGELLWFLGIRIIRDRAQHKLWLCQDSYYEKIAKIYGLSDRPAVIIPVAQLCLDAADSSTIALRYEFVSKLGSLIYNIYATRPDTAYT